MNGIATNPDRSRPVQPPTIFHLGAPTAGVTSLPLVTTAVGTRFHAVTAPLTTTARRAHPAGRASGSVAAAGRPWSQVASGASGVLIESWMSLRGGSSRGECAAPAKVHASSFSAPSVSTTTISPALSSPYLSLIHISEPTRRTPISYAV